VPVRANIFGLRTKTKLGAISQKLGHKGWPVLDKGEIAKRLSQKKSPAFADILSGLKIGGEINSKNNSGSVLIFLV